MVAVMNFNTHAFIVSSNNIVRRRIIKIIKVVVAGGNHQKSLPNISYLSLMLMPPVLPLQGRLSLLMEMLKPTVISMLLSLNQ